jgi:hypothetical protein
VAPRQAPFRYILDFVNFLMRKQSGFFVIHAFVFLTILLFSFSLVSSATDSYGNTFSCSDTDSSFSSMSYNLKGVLTTIYNGRSTSYTDKCSGKTLTEYYCKNNWIVSTQYSCPDVCSDGACMKSGSSSSSDVISCTDTDGGKSFKDSGILTTKYNGSPSIYSDRCKDNDILVEYYCVNNWIASSTLSCDSAYSGFYVCRDGKCVAGSGSVGSSSSAVVQSCEDADKGMNDKYSKGVLTTIYDGHSTSYTDECFSENEVKEFSCENNWVAYSTEYCGSDCVDGACQGSIASDFLLGTGGVLGKSVASLGGGLIGGLFGGLDSDFFRGLVSDYAVLFFIFTAVIIFFLLRFFGVF